MSTFPQPLVRLRRATARPASGGAVRGAVARAALGLLGVACAVLVAPTALAEPPAAAGPEPSPTGGLDAAAADQDAEAFSAMLADWFARFDERIRNVSAATDRAASRALEGGLGALAAGHDRRMSDHARAALADAPDAAQRHYSLAAVGAGPGSSLRDDPKPSRRTRALPAAPAPR
jgi:hypothetical protein